MVGFYEIRLIGDETVASLVLNIQTKVTFSEEQRENFHLKLQETISGIFPEIHDVYINFIPVHQRMRTNILPDNCFTTPSSSNVSRAARISGDVR